MYKRQPIYLLQQAERITESEVDIEKKKQELYSEIEDVYKRQGKR